MRANSCFQEVGAGIKRALDEGICSRQDLFITTKVTHRLPQPFCSGVSFAAVCDVRPAALEHVSRA